MHAIEEIHHTRAVTLGRRLELLTIVWTAAEAGLGLWSAWQAHALSLAAFGLDSLIELASAAAMLWRLQHQHDPRRREHAEQRSLRVAAICLLALAAYVLIGAVLELRSGARATPNLLGIVVAASAVLLMPLLARSKRRVAALLDSDAMLADSRQADFCALQALIVLVGLVVTRWWDITWADSAAALLLVPLIAREGIRALQGKSCGCAGGTTCSSRTA
jgi:divalent metal cation (Fe/Co/Zn/Cd) transporter